MRDLMRLRAPIAEDIFLQSSLMWLEHESRSSIIKPNDVACSTLQIGWPCNWIIISLQFSARNFWRLLIAINSVFAIFRLSLLAFSQLLSSELVACSSSAKVQPGTVILVSSANILAQDVSRQLGPPRYRCNALPTDLWNHTLGARSIYWVRFFREEWNDVMYIYCGSRWKRRMIIAVNFPI